MSNYESSDKMVSHPSHYIHGGIETIDVIESTLESFGEGAISGFLTGQVMKYISRWKDKNGLQDLEKAQWYLTRLINKEKDKSKITVDSDFDFSEGEHIKLPEELVPAICGACGHNFIETKKIAYRNCPYCGTKF